VVLPATEAACLLPPPGTLCLLGVPGLQEPSSSGADDSLHSGGEFAAAPPAAEAASALRTTAARSSAAACAAPPRPDSPIPQPAQPAEQPARVARGVPQLDAVLEGVRLDAGLQAPALGHASGAAWEGPGAVALGGGQGLGAAWDGLRLEETLQSAGRGCSGSAADAGTSQGGVQHSDARADLNMDGGPGECGPACGGGAAEAVQGPRDGAALGGPAGPQACTGTAARATGCSLSAPGLRRPAALPLAGQPLPQPRAHADGRAAAAADGSSAPACAAARDAAPGGAGAASGLGVWAERPGPAARPDREQPGADSGAGGPAAAAPPTAVHEPAQVPQAGPACAGRGMGQPAGGGGRLASGRGVQAGGLGAPPGARPGAAPGAPQAGAATGGLFGGRPRAPGGAAAGLRVRPRVPGNDAGAPAAAGAVRIGIPLWTAAALCKHSVS